MIETRRPDPSIHIAKRLNVLLGGTINEIIIVDRCPILIVRTLDGKEHQVGVARCGGQWSRMVRYLRGVGGKGVR